MNLTATDSSGNIVGFSSIARRRASVFEDVNGLVGSKIIQGGGHDDVVSDADDSSISLQSISTESTAITIPLKSIPPPPPVVELSSPAVVVPTASFSSDNEVVSSFLQPHHA